MIREIVFDTETTGLNHKTDRIVEIGCIELIDLIPTGREFHSYVNPQCVVPDNVVKIHGLTTQFLKAEPTFRRVVSKFLDFIEDSPLIAHNAQFDINFINAELERLCLPDLPNPVIDTLVLAREVRPRGKHDLDSLCAHYKIDKSKRTRHGALVDSEILAKVYLALKGGRQRGMDLVVVDTASPIVPTKWPSRQLPPRLTAEDLDRHEKFIQEAIGPTALWNHLEGGEDG